jgi:hypothetical protein
MIANVNLILLLLLLLLLLLFLLLLFNGFLLNSFSLDAMTTSTLKPVGHNTHNSCPQTKQFTNKQTNKHRFQLQTTSVEVKLCFDRPTGKPLDYNTGMKADVCTCAVVRDFIRHILANQRQP